MQTNNWARLLAYVTGLVNQRLLLRCEYLIAENRILRSRPPGNVRLSDPERRTLAEIGKRLGRHLRAEVVCVAKPETILGWHACTPNPMSLTVFGASGLPLRVLLGHPPSMIEEAIHVAAAPGTTLPASWSPNYPKQTAVSAFATDPAHAPQASCRTVSELRRACSKTGRP